MFAVLKDQLFSRKSRRQSYSGADEEKSAEWYDDSFERAEHWKSHYTESKYYFIWSVIVDRLIRAGKQSVLEVGCGPGQLACLIKDKKVEHYQGFDFSPKRIQQAKKVCPEFNFNVEDAFKTRLFSSRDYDAVVCTEFLEHVEGDLEVIQRIKKDTYFIGTVPNFPYTSHVRHFNSIEDVYERYSPLFDNFRVDSFLGNNKGKVYYILEGYTK